MRGGQSAIIGLLLPNIINEFYARFANSLAILCADRSLDLVIHLTNDDPEREQQSLLRLQALQASTVILVPAPDAVDTSERFATSMRIIELIRTRHGAEVRGKLLIEVFGARQIGCLSGSAAVARNESGCGPDPNRRAGFHNGS